MISVSPLNEENDEAAERQMDFIIASHSIADLESHGLKGVPELIRFLADPLDELASRAVFVLKRVVPLAAMLERWVDDQPKFPETSTNIPQWIIDSCRGWGTINDFPSQCAREFLRLGDDQDSCERFLRRVVLFPGAQRRFCQSLLEAGKKEAVARFNVLIEEQQKIHYPPQIGISPTMNCQLHCDFCVSGGHQQLKEAPLASLIDILNWTENNDVTRVGFSGGEPTLYSDFTPLVEYLTTRGLEYYLATNGIVADRVLQTICSNKPKSVTMHLTSEVLEGDLLGAFLNTARRLVQEEIYVILRINFSHLDMKVDRYLDVAAETGIGEVRAAVPMPNATRYNNFIALEQLSAYGQVLEQYIEEGKKRHLETILAKPFPLCLMPEEVARVFLSNGSVANNCPVHRGKCANNVVVMPDGTCIPCLGLNKTSPKPIHGYSSLEEVGNLFHDEVQRLTNIPLFESCHHCPFWCGGRCLGGCLSYRLNSENEGVI